MLPESQRHILRVPNMTRIILLTEGETEDIRVIRDRCKEMKEGKRNVSAEQFSRDVERLLEIMSLMCIG